MCTLTWALSQLRHMKATHIFVSEQNGVLLFDCHQTAGKKTLFYLLQTL